MDLNVYSEVRAALSNRLHRVDMRVIDRETHTRAAKMCYYCNI